MKGITHFISGIAVATFFPQAVHMASQEQSFILCLGGVFGILPDTLDFKFARYFHQSDFEIAPDHERPDPRVIAETVAKAIHKAIASGRGTVQLHTIQLGANLWRSYKLWFDRATSEVCCEIGPLVDTGQTPFEGTEPAENRSARVKVPCKLFQEFDKASNISIMSGPCFEFIKRGDGEVEIVFLPWHRTWSHSATLGLFMAALVGLVAYFTVPEGPHAALYSLPRWSLYPLIILFGSLVHIIEDSTGFMGNNLFWPFTADRTKGMGLMSAAEAVPNFFFVWTSVICIIFNLDRFRFDPDSARASIASYPSFFFWFYAIPVAIMFYLLTSGKKSKKAHDAPVSAPPPDTARGEDFDRAQAVEQETDVTSV